MNQEPLFDLSIRDARLRRSIMLSKDPKKSANYLYEHSAKVLADRIRDVTRNFNDILEIGYRDDTLKNHVIETLQDKSTDQRISYDALSFIDLNDKDIKTIGHDEVLPIQAQTYDLVISNLSLHHCNDIIGIIIQAKLALKPDGLLLISLFGAETLKEFRDVMRTVEAEITGGISPRFAPLVDIRDGGGLLQRANMALPVADKEIVTVSYSNGFRLMTDLRAMGQTNMLNAQHKKIMPRNFFPKVCTHYAHQYGDENNHIPASFDIVTLTGWAPADNQQKPLKPGSAKNNLAAALNTEETVLKS